MSLKIKGFLLPPFKVSDKYGHKVIFTIPTSLVDIYFFEFTKFLIPFDSRTKKPASINFNKLKPANWNKAGWYNNIRRNLPYIIWYNAVRLTIKKNKAQWAVSDNMLKGDVLRFSEILPFHKLLLIQNIKSLHDNWGKLYFYFNDPNNLLKTNPEYYFKKFDSLWNYSFNTTVCTDLVRQTDDLIDFFNPVHNENNFELQRNIFIEDLFPSEYSKGLSKRDYNELFSAAFENDASSMWGTDFF